MSTKDLIIEELSKAYKHLKYSFDKIQTMNLDSVSDEDEESLETLESFSSRFARFTDILIAKYFRVLVLEKDPAFRGSIIDILNQAEKYGWINSAAQFKKIRELRNLAAHEYLLKDYISLYRELLKLCPICLSVDLNL